MEELYDSQEIVANEGLVCAVFRFHFEPLSLCTFVSYRNSCNESQLSCEQSLPWSTETQSSLDRVTKVANERRLLRVLFLQFIEGVKKVGDEPALRQNRNGLRETRSTDEQGGSWPKMRMRAGF